MAPLHVIAAGLRPYDELLTFQRWLQRERIAKRIPDTVIICEHPPTITLGTGADAANLLRSREELATRGIAVAEVERGGDITYHGPGQIVLYPIIDLNDHRRDVHWYMRILEEVIIRTVSHFGVSGHRIDGKTGVWVDRGGAGQNPLRKIASLGVKLSRWCSMHGVSLNVEPQDGFALINPCGFTDIVVTSIREELEYRGVPSPVECSVETVGRIAIREVAELLHREPVEIPYEGTPQ